VVFSTNEELAEQSAYYKEQSVVQRLSACQATYKDIFLMFGKTVEIPSPSKHERVHMCRMEIEYLADSAKKEVDVIRQKIQSVKGKPGFREEENYWRGLFQKTPNIVAELEALDQQSKELEEQYRAKYGEFKSEKAHSRRKKKNKKKSVKRLQKRQEGRKKSA